MELEQIIKLIDHVSDSKVTSFLYETEGVKLSMECGQSPAFTMKQVQPKFMLENGKEEETAAEFETPEPVKMQGKLVKSPLVGTFYAAPSEEAEPFVTVGSQVKKGQVMAIVEAMKLMNEIESEFDGEVAEIYVKNGEAVEYGQPLFRIL